MKLSIMLEGQNGLNWGHWKNWVSLAEDLGFYGLYRSDHFTNANPPDKDSLELWVSLTYLASQTKRIKFGPLVSPLSFRHPAHTARMAAAVDDLSGGRLKLGLGAGWQEREHQHYGFDLMTLKPRFNRFEEGLEVITKMLKSSAPFDFSGAYYNFKDVILLPRPERKNGPEILIGGNGKKMTLPLVVKYADEWNAVLIGQQVLKDTSLYLDQLLKKQGREPSSVRRSMMTNLTYADSDRKLDQKLKGKSKSELQNQGIIVGVGEEVIQQIKAYQSIGVEEIMLQWLDFEDIFGIQHFAKTILPVFHQE
ncbi:MAG: LLM class F420-dependent oxidoreductase [Anaerolineaceae bacterium]|nr:LLM class F420-dependent oxidoreductase [Anaerolineaceae bacterium]